MTIDNQEWQARPVQDYFLTHLVQLANEGVFTGGLTLNCGGILVCGILISAEAYFHGFAQQFASAITGSDPEWAKGYFEGFGTAWPENQTNQKGVLPEYIHLTNARYMTADGGSLGPTIEWWRSPIHEVTAFHLGMQLPL